MSQSLSVEMEIRSTSDTQVKTAHVIRTTTNKIDGDGLRLATFYNTCRHTKTDVVMHELKFLWTVNRAMPFQYQVLKSGTLMLMKQIV